MDDIGVKALQDIPAGHKILLGPVRKGDPILKYATVIGFAGADAAPGT